MLMTPDEMTIAGFLDHFHRIVREKEAAGISAIHNNPADLLDRAKLYGLQYKNGSWGWASNVWSRSAAGTMVVDREEDLCLEQRQLMLRTLEHILCRPLIQVDRTLGTPGERAAMHCRLYCDPQFPDIAYRWGELAFPADPSAEPDATLFCLPHYLGNPHVPGSDELLSVLRFPNHGYTIVTISSYQGEVKKAFLSHWIKFAHDHGGTGEHAALREFTVRRVDGTSRSVVMSVWGLTGSGKSTHGMYAVDEAAAAVFQREFGVNPLDWLSDQTVKNDDIVAVFPDRVLSSEKGSWTKTEDVDAGQIGIYRAATAPHALHENTEWDETGEVSFAGRLFQYWGRYNQNARTVLRLEDTGFFDGDINSSGPLNMAVFISPGYVCDHAWVKLVDPAFAAKVLADGRTVGHPAQSHKGIGEVKYETRYCRPFTMGVPAAAHVHRFHTFLEARLAAGDPIEVFRINTTGRVGAEYRWEPLERDGTTVEVPRVVFEEVNGKRTPVGGTGPTIEETELFLFQAARGAVEYKSHPIWGEKVLVPVKVPGLSDERLKALSPFTYHSIPEMRRLLVAQVETSKAALAVQCPGLDPAIHDAMDF